jgi:hypothetical protein
LHSGRTKVAGPQQSSSSAGGTVKAAGARAANCKTWCKTFTEEKLGYEADVVALIRTCGQQGQGMDLLLPKACSRDAMKEYVRCNEGLAPEENQSKNPWARLYTACRSGDMKAARKALQNIEHRAKNDKAGPHQGLFGIALGLCAAYAQYPADIKIHKSGAHLKMFWELCSFYEKQCNTSIRNFVLSEFLYDGTKSLINALLFAKPAGIKLRPAIMDFQFFEPLPVSEIVEQVTPSIPIQIADQAEPTLHIQIVDQVEPTIHIHYEDWEVMPPKRMTRASKEDQKVERDYAQEPYSSFKNAENGSISDGRHSNSVGTVGSNYSYENPHSMEEDINAQIIRVLDRLDWNDEISSIQYEPSTDGSSRYSVPDEIGSVAATLDHDRCRDETVVMGDHSITFTSRSASDVTDDLPILIDQDLMQRLRSLKERFSAEARVKNLPFKKKAMRDQFLIKEY